MKRLTLLVVLALTLSGSFLLGGRTAQSSRPIRVIRLYTGSDGQTHSEEPTLKLSANRSLSEVSDPEKALSVQFWRASAGLVNDWHPAPTRQYNIRLKGRLEVELAGGKKIQLAPGQIVLAEDVTGKGHITRCLGPEDCVSVLIPLDGER